MDLIELRDDLSLYTILIIFLGGIARFWLLQRRPKYRRIEESHPRLSLDFRVLIYAYFYKDGDDAAQKLRRELSKSGFLIMLLVIISWFAVPKIYKMLFCLMGVA